MLDPNTPAGTKVLCVNTRNCFSSCNCGGDHELSPLKEGRVYTVGDLSSGCGVICARAGFVVHVAEIYRDASTGGDVGYAPDRFIPLEPKWSATRRADRVPVSSKKLEEA